MECDQKSSTPDVESAERKTPKEIIGETVKHCLDDLTSCDTDEAEQFVS